MITHFPTFPEARKHRNIIRLSSRTSVLTIFEMGDFGDSSDIIDNGALFALVCHSYGQMVADEYFNRFFVHAP